MAETRTFDLTLTENSKIRKLFEQKVMDKKNNDLDKLLRTESFGIMFNIFFFSLHLILKFD